MDLQGHLLGYYGQLFLHYSIGRPSLVRICWISIGDLVGRCYLECLVGKLGEGILSLPVEMDEWGWVSVQMWVSWPLMAAIFSAEHFAVTSLHSFPKMPT
jgi:hypothetical protein